MVIEKRSLMRAIYAFLIVFIVIMVLHLSDMFCGYRISEGIDKVFSVSERETDFPPSQSAVSTNRLDDSLYRSLSDEKRASYDSIYNAISGFKSTVIVYHFNSSQEAFDMVNLVMSEHPELFWFNGRCTYGAGGILGLQYIYSKSEAMEKKKLIEEKAEEIISGISGDEYTRALAIYDYIVLNTRYDLENVNRLLEVPTDSTIEGVLLNQTAVCAGYAKTYQYLLQKAGLSALYVIGEATNRTTTQSHAWVVQQIDGKYYYSDPTWGDPDKGDIVVHGYFCLTADEMNENHELDKMYPLLTANSLEANYFVRENRYFDEYSLSAVKQAIDESLDNHQNYVELRYKTQELYEQANERLFDNGELYLAFFPANLIKYSIDTDNMSIISDDIHRIITIVYDKVE